MTALRKRKIRITPLDLLIFLLILAGAIYLSYKIRIGLNYNWNWQAIPQYFFRYDPERGKWVANLIMQGLFTTIRLSIWGTVLATVVGTIVGFCRLSPRLFNPQLAPSGSDLYFLLFCQQPDHAYFGH